MKITLNSQTNLPILNIEDTSSGKVNSVVKPFKEINFKKENFEHSSSIFKKVVIIF